MAAGRVSLNRCRGVQARTHLGQFLLVVIVRSRSLIGRLAAKVAVVKTARLGGQELGHLQVLEDASAVGFAATRSVRVFVPAVSSV